jgi:hypothetical protein
MTATKHCPGVVKHGLQPHDAPADAFGTHPVCKAHLSEYRRIKAGKSAMAAAEARLLAELNQPGALDTPYQAGQRAIRDADARLQVVGHDDSGLPAHAAAAPDPMSAGAYEAYQRDIDTAEQAAYRELMARGPASTITVDPGDKLREIEALPADGGYLAAIGSDEGQQALHDAAQAAADARKASQRAAWAEAKRAERARKKAVTA